MQKDSSANQPPKGLYHNDPVISPPIVLNTRGSKKQNSVGFWVIVFALITIAALLIVQGMGCSYLPNSNDTYTIGGTVESVTYDSNYGNSRIVIKFLEQTRAYTFYVDRAFDLSALKWKQVQIKYRMPQAPMGMIKWELIEIKVI